MTDKKVKYIKVTDGGPYLVFGSPKIVEEIIVPDEEGASFEYEARKDFSSTKEPVALCRCGRSKNMPYCDGSHAKAPWHGKESASFEPVENEAEIIEGPNLDLLDNQKYCAYARFCDARGRVWNLVLEGSKEADEQTIKEVCNCPAGRLMLKNKEGQHIEPKLEQEIGVLEDVANDCSGPLWVKGGIRVESADGKSYELRNRQTLCRCGRSSNKPFCDGSHAAEPKFKV